jgi:hypothetical protein
LRALDWFITREKHIRLIGASYLIDPMQYSRIFYYICGARVAFPVAAAMVLLVLLVVGRWSPLLTLAQILHTSGNSMKVIPNVFVAGLKYSFQSKLYLACNLGYFVFRPDLEKI